MNIAILAGGCFWCTEAVFQRVKGVEEVKSGFCGGHIKNPAYREVVTQRTGHAEAVKITYDPEIISYKELLMVFMATHDPTTLNRQGHDVGTHYRSAIYYTSERQHEIALRYIKELTDQGVFENAIVTEVAPATPFYDADDIHDDYYNNNRLQGYCQYVIDPKVRKLMTQYADLVK
ncbi:peptide-methionine (S)-S-oxide reductase MsrA [Nonlabens ulvanivorans]|uniref:Peptide methionine sulfoxide reductase MsrA n=1 Tax=Nonlabens ulvanivorans TaxID=906888 RepID=A0A084K094_NONUL|nr:peptide-methionine (S)-S-oxide reductase MsrA [Nonlabens ulvanivorans]KEZ94628.1 methionine sulfoxide reductase A [Nonlabens ulvanivorans]PRX12541.1 peptide-methionine (S)-S-oxide reductase [Nonlabens ulvanivorans]